jgi:hypothetical protein
VAGARALTGLALPAGCGPALTALAAGVLSGGAGFLLSPLLGGVALVGAWLALTISVAAAVGLAARALTAPGGRQASTRRQHR